MTTFAFIALSLILGYVVTVGLTLAVTFGLVAAMPGFVTEDHRLSSRYKLLQDVVWLGSAMAGGYVTTMTAGGQVPWFAATLLAVALIVALWRNAGEARQRGIFHQLLACLLTVVGVAAGYVLWVRP